MKKRILLVDDDLTSLKTLSSILASHDYELKTSTHAQEIEKSIQSFNPHLIIMDLLMPHVDGNEAVRRIQKDPALNSIPLIFLTAVNMNATDQGMEFEISVNNRSYRTFTKPVDSKTFLSEVQNILK